MTLEYLGSSGPRTLVDLSALRAAAPSQATWYVDPTNGNDANIGSSAGAALKTLGEFFSRMSGQGNTVPQTINLLGDCTGEGFIYLRGTFRNFVTLQGVQTTCKTGTLTNVIAYNHTPGSVAIGKITDSALTGQWSNSGGVNLLSKCIILTSGANAGSWAWLLRDEGSKQAVVSTWLKPNTFGEITPTVGDAYKVVDFTAVGPIQSDAWGIIAQDVTFTGNKPSFYSSFWAQDGSGTINITRCKFNGDGSSLTGAQWYSDYGTFFEHCFWADSPTFHNAYLFGGAVKNGAVTGYNGAIEVDGPAFIALGTDSLSHEFILQENACLRVWTTIGVICAPAGNVVQLRSPSNAILMGTLWSSGSAAGQGIWCGSGCSFTWAPSTANANTKFSFGAANDTVVGLTNKSIADLGTTGFFNTANGAACVPGKRHPGTA